MLTLFFRESDVLIKADSPIEGEFLVLNELQLRYCDRLKTANALNEIRQIYAQL